MAYKQVRLGDYFKFEKGLGYKGEFLVEESGVGLVGIDSQVPGGGYKENSEKPYSGPYKPEHVVDSGDVIVAATDITQDGSVLGSTFMIPESTNYETLIYSGDVMKAIPLKPDEFSLEYFYNLYRVEKYREKMAYGDTGTTVRRLSEDGICEQLVPLPDLPTQQAINEIIAIFDQQIANNKALSKSLEMLAQAMFKSWFIDFEPVHAKSNGEKPFGMDDATAAIFPSTFEKAEIGDIPKGWEVKSLDEICVYLNGLALQKFPPKSDDHWLPVIKIAQLKSGNVSKADKASPDIKPQYIVQNGDILFSWSATLEVEHWVSGPGALNQHLFKVTGSQVPNWLAYLFTKNSLPTFRAIASEKATSMGHIQRGHLTSERYAVPSEDFISHMEQIFHPIIEQKIQNLVENSRLESARRNLLDGLISGQLSVPKEMIAS